MTCYNRYFADVSSHQPSVNMESYANAGHVLIAIKATEGLTYVNPYHRGQCLAAGSHHLAVVHYHFARPDLGHSPNSEAQHFLGVALPLAGPYDYLVLDLERATPQGWTHDPSWSYEFSRIVAADSRFHVILYASRNVLQQSDVWLYGEPKRVWDADYSTSPNFAPPGYTVAFRQFTDGIVGPYPHYFAGIGECDGNSVGQDIYQHLLQYRH